MPYYADFTWQDFKVKAKPIGIRRLFQFWPYVTRQEPKFKVTIDTISGDPRPLLAHLHGSDSTQHGLNISQGLISHPKTPVNSYTKTVKLQPIVVSGDHRIKIDLRWEEKNHSDDLVTFRAIAHEIVWGWIIGTLIGISVLVVGIWNLVLLINQQ